MGEAERVTTLARRLRKAAAAEHKAQRASVGQPRVAGYRRLIVCGVVLLAAAALALLGVLHSRDLGLVLITIVVGFTGSDAVEKGAGAVRARLGPARPLREAVAAAGPDEAPKARPVAEYEDLDDEDLEEMRP